VWCGNVELPQQQKQDHEDECESSGAASGHRGAAHGGCH